MYDCYLIRLKLHMLILQDTQRIKVAEHNARPSQAQLATLLLLQLTWEDCCMLSFS